jgi:hypothetical protein
MHIIQRYCSKYNLIGNEDTISNKQRDDYTYTEIFWKLEHCFI